MAKMDGNVTSGNGSSHPIVKVGIIGCGEITQTVHIPTIGFLRDLMRITYLCDVSKDSLDHCQQLVAGVQPKVTIDPEELCKSSDVDVVFVANSNEYHALHAVLALKYHKHVFIEKPMALNFRDADAIIAAEKESEGKVMVGYMRRFAAGFEDAIKEIGDLDEILYVRVRDIIGPNSAFVTQNGTYPKRFSDFTMEDTTDRLARGDDIMNQALNVECKVPVTPESKGMWGILGGLGSHDLSAMREAVGMPTKVIGASLGFPFWNVLFKFPNFTVSYESGIDNVPRFDAHIEVYGRNKTVRVQYDTPYIKGLPVTMHVQENLNGVYQERMVRTTFEDPYTREMKVLYDVVVNGEPVKTTAEDARKDLEIFQMIMQAGVKSV